MIIRYTWNYLQHRGWIISLTFLNHHQYINLIFGNQREISQNSYNPGRCKEKTSIFGFWSQSAIYHKIIFAYFLFIKADQKREDCVAEPLPFLYEKRKKKLYTLVKAQTSALGLYCWIQYKNAARNIALNQRIRFQSVVLCTFQ